MEGIFHDGMKEGKKHHHIKPPVGRKRGKLSKKEEKEMKRKHNDIEGMLAPPPTQEATNHEKRIANEMEELEKIDEEREERQERIIERKKEWKARNAQETVIMINKDMGDCVDAEKDAKMTGVHEHKDVNEVEGHKMHTPRPGPMNYWKEMLSVMTVVHTP